ncbi:unnamed protein product [Phytomonas sp. Hart1]|nr:unnamed protein product [Phytomonas sp. Hart1]|eukprot:CCW72166.1 unnamed protein product [Phytomonas sp. isolate Hart1]
MTTRVELRKIAVNGPNPSRFDDPIALKIVLEVFEKAPESVIDIRFTWSPIWDFPVDQSLDELEVGPLTSLGKHELLIETDPPDFRKIPDPTGPTALLVSFSYLGREFLHVGYNVIVSCKGEIPDVFESADCLTRQLGRCFTKPKGISWDAPEIEDHHRDDSKCNHEEQTSDKVSQES